MSALLEDIANADHVIALKRQVIDNELKIQVLKNRYDNENKEFEESYKEYVELRKLIRRYPAVAKAYESFKLVAKLAR